MCATLRDMQPPPEWCEECTKDLDKDGDCFECGTEKYARDCKCGKGDWLCPWHQRNEDCRGKEVKL